METVIAKSKKTILAAYIVILVAGVIFAALGGFTLALGEAIGVFLLVVGLFLIGIGIGWTVYISKQPTAYITFKEGKFYFFNGVECSPSEVDYCNTRSAGLDGAFMNYGKLIISVRNTVYKFKFVEGVEAVAANINALKAQYLAIEEMQKHIADNKAAEEAQIAENADIADTTEDKN